jgi:DNA-binding HxlR family transcriptional regulator
MEHFAHEQNLAHCRRQLAEAELATSSDEIRHSMLMRRLAEEEANGLVMQVTVTVRPNRRAAG